MNPREQGFLLLSSHLGDPARKVLSDARLRNLAARVQTMPRPTEDRELTVEDLVQIGYDPVDAGHIVTLLSQEEQLKWYLSKAEKLGCRVLTRANPDYPVRLRRALNNDATGCIWYKGDISLLQRPCISLVGSRDLRPPNEAFAKEVGEQAARQGFVLISGNARGADRAAQDACLSHGGCVISVVADQLHKYKPYKNVLFISEDDFDLPFSSQRALHRNRVIHALGSKVFVAQSTSGSGGTWSGTIQNLKNGWSPVFCYDDASDGAQALMKRGATGIGFSPLENLTVL